MKSAFNKNTQPAILRVFQSKDQTKAFYNKISQVYDVLSERSEAPMRRAGFELLKARAGESAERSRVRPGFVAKSKLLERVHLRCGDAAQICDGRTV